jgi:hypothetical protein
MKRRPTSRHLALLVVTSLAALTACSATAKPAAHTAAATSSSVPVPSTAPSTPLVVTTTAVVVVPPPVPTPTPSPFADGYPKQVTVASLPSQVKNWMQIGGYTSAVQVAPGVWTPLPPGASVMDAATTGPLDGFCASITAYVNQYRGGLKPGGACW